MVAHLTESLVGFRTLTGLITLRMTHSIAVAAIIVSPSQFSGLSRISPLWQRTVVAAPIRKYASTMLSLGKSSCVNVGDKNCPIASVILL